MLTRIRIALGILLHRPGYIGFHARYPAPSVLLFDVTGNMESGEIEFLADVIPDIADEIGGGEIVEQMAEAVNGN